MKNLFNLFSNKSFLLSLSLQRRIMLRVYFWYTVSITQMRAWWVGAILGSSLVVFYQLVSVGIVLKSMLYRPIIELPEYIFSLFYQAFLDGEFMLLLVCIALVCSMWYGYRLYRSFSWQTNLPSLISSDQYSTN